MKLKHLVASISASFDDLVSKIENHEAIAEVSLQEIRVAAAKIRTQFNITRQRLEYLHNQESTLRQDCERWQLRAVQCAEQDRERALRCVQAMEQCDQQRKALPVLVEVEVRTHDDHARALVAIVVREPHLVHVPRPKDLAHAR